MVFGHSVGPMVPKALPFVVTCLHDAMVHGFISSSELMRVVTLELRRSSRQESFCRGNLVLNLVRNSKYVSDLCDPSGRAI